MQSVTEKQKAYHLRKMRTRMTRMDVNKDGYISREDYELMADKLAEYGKLTKEQAESSRKALMDVADVLGFKPGIRKNIEETAKQVTEAFQSMTPERKMEIFNNSHKSLFDAIDTNKNGHISAEEFKVYFKIIGPRISEEEVLRSFNAIDSNGNGRISREEFLAAADDFLHGYEETELSKAFFGSLLS